MSGVDILVLAPGDAEADVLTLDEPLSFWGGADPTNGTIIDTHHPQLGASFAGRILVLPGGRGSSSSSSVLAECIRNGTGPAGIVLGHADPILALGAFVADALYRRAVPIIVPSPAMWIRCSAAQRLRITAADELAEIEVLA